MSKRFIEVQDRAMDLNTTKCKKCFDMVSELMLNKPLRNYCLLSFGIVLKKNFIKRLQYIFSFS